MAFAHSACAMLRTDSRLPIVPVSADSVIVQWRWCVIMVSFTINPKFQYVRLENDDCQFHTLSGYLLTVDKRKHIFLIPYRPTIFNWGSAEP